MGAAGIVIIIIGIVAVIIALFKKGKAEEEEPPDDVTPPDDIPPDEPPTVVAPVITAVSFSPANLTDAKHEYTSDLGIGYWGDAFTATITIKNPNDFGIWVRPDFALGKLAGSELVCVDEDDLLPTEKDNLVSGFEAAPLLYYRLIKIGGTYEGDYSVWGFKWQKMYDAQNLGSNMVQYPKDPDGIAIPYAGTNCWLHISAKGQATTTKEGHLGVKDNELVPATFDICAIVGKAFYLINEPHISSGEEVNYKAKEMPSAAKGKSGVVNIERTVYPPPAPQCPACGSTEFTSIGCWGVVCYVSCDSCGKRFYINYDTGEVFEVNPVPK